MTITDAIKAINANAKFSVIDDDIDQITWLDGTSEISKEDIQTKLDELNAGYDTEDWKRNRQAEYPSHDECIHALLDGGDTLTDLQTKRTATKNKYPKPE